MPNAFIRFQAPTKNTTAIAALLVDNYAQIDGYENEDLDYGAVEAFLRDSTGEMIDVEFEDFDDDPIHPLVEVLNESSTKYFAYWQSHEDRARGDRYGAGYAVRVDHMSFPVTKAFPWTDGEPDTDARNMRLAHFTDAEIHDIEESFFPGRSAPRP